MKCYPLPWHLLAFLLASLAVSACQPAYTESFVETEPKASAQMPGHLTARYFGVSTILFSDGESALMIDGFFSRPTLEELLKYKVVPNESRIKEALKRGEVGHLAAVVVAHSHVDHAMDSATVAGLNGGVVIGSESTAIIARSEKFPESRIVVFKKDETITVNRFKITVFESQHSKGGFEELLEGPIEKDFKTPASAWKYREGGSYSFLIENGDLRVIVHPGAEFTEGMYAGKRADIVFLATATMSKMPKGRAEAYWKEVVENTGARLVIPTHWDDFFEVLGEKQLTPSAHPLGDFAYTMKWLAKPERKNICVRMLPLYKRIDLAKMLAEIPSSCL
jgi:L-ascorbate metabolism protein UlaG (beta-lactamase superfamily)